MLDKLGLRLSEFIFLIGISISILSLFFSPFLLSAGTAILLLSLLVEPKRLLSIGWTWVFLYATPLILLVIDFLRNENVDVITAKILLMLGFFVIASAVQINKQCIKKYSQFIYVLWLIAVLLVNVLSVTNYYMNKEILDSLLLQSKSIPIIGGMHHIHFGIINAISILITLYLLLFRQFSSKIQKNLLIVSLILLLFSFHTLSSRTGLVSLYGSLAVCLFIYAIVKRDIKHSLILVGAMVVINALALSFSTSFKNKLANSVEDVESWDNESSINYKSMGMRLESYKNSWFIIKQNLLFGVGAGQAESEIQWAYEERKTVLYMENRIGPHNQFLEFGIKYGLIGIIYIGLWFLYWLYRSFDPLQFLLLALVLLILFSSQFESLFERQVSIFFTAGIFPMVRHAFSSEN